MRKRVMSKLLWPLILVSVFSVPAAFSQEQADAARKGPRRRTAAQIEVYKTINDFELKMHIFNPDGHTPKQKRPAIVFFFGGGWNGGSTSQFANHCRYLASRGMVAMAADYRVYSRQQATVVDCVADAKSAIRWVRHNAARLGVDPNRIAAGGGSAGGHLAAAVATLDGFDEKGEDLAISARPNAVVLFNPALDLTPNAFSEAFRKKRYASFAKRWGTKPENLSPTHHVSKGVPPTIIFHGKSDTTVPYAQAEAFTRAMKHLGNRCQLVGFEGAQHGFFNYGRNRNKSFIATLRQADQFLASLGYLRGKPSVESFVAESRR
jgi:acetyl esterase/lipase